MIINDRKVLYCKRISSGIGKILSEWYFCEQSGKGTMKVCRKYADVRSRCSVSKILVRHLKKREMDCRVVYFEPTNNVLEVRYGNFVFDGYFMCKVIAQVFLNVWYILARAKLQHFTI